ncbi:MAG TPA: DUF488 family protein [Thermodesulforhabdus norvegica]|uniref:DUF488 family protein n=1 Tax=Thermodesulforhabdus norvegica TaxID=39841 RepID=A0A7C0WRF1_9BACT|nr:DUF488 family protein [Deltaproteobacteria bacterium]MBW2068926.1 DUF488 family protein [Deltaproteobacteria bacterium]HDL89564.1 DUF488 family protein [Thermodesulforhabdus norvegica]
MAIRIKSIFEPPEAEDGLRYLIEQSIPAGIDKDSLELTGWIKELAPGVTFDPNEPMDEDSWRKFRRLYYQELMDPSKEPALALLTEKAQSEVVTLVFRAADPRRNHAVVLKTLIELRMRIYDEF